MIIPLRSTFRCLYYFTLLSLTIKHVGSTFGIHYYKPTYERYVTQLMHQNALMNVHMLLNKVKRDKIRGKRKWDRDKEHQLEITDDRNVGKNINLSTDYQNNLEISTREVIPKVFNHDADKNTVSKKAENIHKFKNGSMKIIKNTEGSHQTTHEKKDVTTHENINGEYDANGSKRDLTLPSVSYEDTGERHYDPSPPTLLKQFQRSWHSEDNNLYKTSTQGIHLSKANINKRASSTINIHLHVKGNVNTESISRTSEANTKRKQIHRRMSKRNKYDTKEKEKNDREQLPHVVLDRIGAKVIYYNDNADNGSADAIDVTTAQANSITEELAVESERPKLEMHRVEIRKKELSGFELGNVDEGAAGIKGRAVNKKQRKGTRHLVKPGGEATQGRNNRSYEDTNNNTKYVHQNVVQSDAMHVANEIAEQARQKTTQPVPLKNISTINDSEVVNKDTSQSQQPAAEIVENSKLGDSAINTKSTSHYTVHNAKSEVANAVQNSYGTIKAQNENVTRYQKSRVNSTLGQSKSAEQKTIKDSVDQISNPSALKEIVKVSAKSFSDMIVEDVINNKKGYGLNARNADLDAAARHLSNPKAPGKEIGSNVTTGIKTINNPVTGQRILPFLGNRKTSKHFRLFVSKSKGPRQNSSLLRSTQDFNNHVEPNLFHHHHNLQYIYPLNYNSYFINNVTNYSKKDNNNNILKRSDFLGYPRNLAKGPVHVALFPKVTRFYAPTQAIISNLSNTQKTTGQRHMIQAGIIGQLNIQNSLSDQPVLQNNQHTSEESVVQPIRDYEHVHARLSAQTFHPPSKPNIYDKILKSVQPLMKKKGHLDAEIATSYLNSYYKHVKKITNDKNFWREILNNYTGEETMKSNVTDTLAKRKEVIPYNSTRLTSLSRYDKRKRRPLVKCYKGHCQRVRQYADVKGSKKDILIGRLAPMLEMQDQEPDGDYASEINGGINEEAGDDGVSWKENDAESTEENKDNLKENTLIRKFTQPGYPKGINMQKWQMQCYTMAIPY